MSILQQQFAEQRFTKQYQLVNGAQFPIPPDVINRPVHACPMS